MHRLVWAFACCTFHIVRSLMSRLIYKEPVKQSVFSSHLSSREPRPRAQSIIAYNDVCHELRAICQAYASLRLTWRIARLLLKGTATLMISMFCQKELYEPWFLIQVSSKSVEQWASYGHLKNSIWPTFSRHFEYLISFQNFFNCLIFSYHYYHIICVSADI